MMDMTVKLVSNFNNNFTEEQINRFLNNGHARLRNSLSNKGYYWVEDLDSGMDIAYVKAGESVEGIYESLFSMSHKAAFENECWKCNTDIGDGRTYCTFHCPHEEYDEENEECIDCGKHFEPYMMVESLTKALEDKGLFNVDLGPHIDELKPLPDIPEEKRWYVIDQYGHTVRDHDNKEDAIYDAKKNDYKVMRKGALVPLD